MPPGWTGCRTIRSAFHQIAQRLLDAFAFARVVGFRDRAGFAAQFEAEQNVFQLVEAAADFAVEVRRNAREALAAPEL